MRWCISSVFFLLLAGCTSVSKTSTAGNNIRLVTLDPGHFHAALVQKTMYQDVDSVVHVYAPEGPDLRWHLDRVFAYNKRPSDPTRWEEIVYTGNDFLEKMIAEKRGNVVVMAGNNRKKTEYINRAVEAGFHVLADKPMAIDPPNFTLLQKAFATAAEKNVLLYDIMTERYEITSMLQRAFSMEPSVFGQLEKGSPENPAITKESVHHFYKYVSGNILTRPPWFFDVLQEGEGIVDVTTHLVDLVQWAAFPEQVIDYKKDVQLTSARRWPTYLSGDEFNAVTKLDGFPDYLKKDLIDSSQRPRRVDRNIPEPGPPHNRTNPILPVYSNGEINYVLNGVHAKVSVVWAYQAPEGTGDTHFSVMRGSKANLVIRQGAEQKFRPVLYIEPVGSLNASDITTALRSVQAKFPGIDLKKTAAGWEVVVPEKYHNGHEAHFAQVMEKFLQYVKEGKLPHWEVPNMIAKYYITTSALELAKQTQTAAQ